MTKETKQVFDDRFAREMTEAAEGMRKVGVMDDASHKLTMRELHLTVDHVSKLERGAKQPTGPALVLLNVIRRKGIEAIL